MPPADQKNENQTSGLVVGVLGQVLSFMDRPWKAAVLIGMMVLGGISYVIWDQRAEIAQAILTNKVKPHLDLIAFRESAAQILRDTRSYGVLLLEIRLGDNVAVAREGFDRDGTTWIPLAGPHQAISEQINTVYLVRFLRNEVVCLDVDTQAPNPEAQAAAKKFNIVRVCMIEVPPIIGVTIGALVVCWQDPPPDEGLENQARIIMGDAALKFAVW